MENIVVGTHNGASVYLPMWQKVVDSVEERAQKTYSNGAGRYDCGAETIGRHRSHFAEDN